MCLKVLTKKELALQLGVSLKTLRNYLRITPGIDYEKIKYCKVIPPPEAKILLAYYNS